MSDFRFAVRSLRSTPVVAVAVILSLGLGIGANTAIFSLVDSLLLKSLPVRAPGRLVLVNDSEESGRNFWATYPAWEEIRDRKLFAGVLAWSAERLESAQSGQSESVHGLWVSRGFFDVLGVTPMLGRGFHQDDDPVPSTEAVLSHGFWQRRFGGDPNAIGRSLMVEGVPFTVIGVTDPSFFGTEVGRRFDVAIPLTSMPLIPGRERSLVNPPRTRVRIMARLDAGQTIERATLALRQAQPSIRESTMPSTWRARFKDTYMHEPLAAVSAATGTSSLRGRYGDPLLVLMVAIGLVLLIACGNVANLLLARAAGRRRELGIRSALGASRAQLVRQLFAESLLLAAAASAVALLVGHWASRLLVAQMTTVLETNVLELPLDGRVLAFTALTGLATAVVFGIVPALRATKTLSSEMLGVRGPGIVERQRAGPGGLLVVAQVALSLVLVAGAGLFLRTFSALANLDLGFEPHRVLMVDIDFTRTRLEPAARVALYDRVCEVARSVPGVEHAACSPAIPIGFRALSTLIDAPKGTALSEQDRAVHKNLITPEWFRTFGTRLLAGRDFSSIDRKDAPRVAIVNESFAQRFLGSSNAVGQIVREDRGSKGKTTLEIVGVVEDTVYRSVRESPPATIYLPLAQEEVAQAPFRSLNVVVRPLSGPPAALAAGVVSALKEVDESLKLTVRPLSDQVNATFNQERVLALVASVFGGLALLLAALGLYGVMAYAVSRRRREIGIRMALGADSGHVARLILGQVAVMVGLGIVIGGVLSLWAARFVQSLLFGLPARDPSLFAGAAAVLVLSAAAASWLPTRRAARVEPVAVLREG